ncbi:hypothetical protein [Pseudoxanthomonas sp. CF125]|uniref:hypothetical protein n=1 Tax=Pseudoxanthomonas sp. CF125 TaxID=1855303 RepID=UPI00088BDDE8|nr:hypothetical protein [Pseudoxanthomonas sp. CF125]SDR15081.1 hypothetical protein SAMN05216569_3358 [Pseudoxanthomonas sp. CF125]
MDTVTSRITLRTEIVKTISLDNGLISTMRIEHFDSERLAVIGQLTADPYSPAIYTLDRSGRIIDAPLVAELKHPTYSYPWFRWTTGVAIFDSHLCHHWPDWRSDRKKTYRVRNWEILRDDPKIIENDGKFRRMPAILSVHQLSGSQFLVKLSDSGFVRAGRYFTILEFDGQDFFWNSPLCELEDRIVLDAMGGNLPPLVSFLNLRGLTLIGDQIIASTIGGESTKATLARGDANYIVRYGMKQDPASKTWVGSISGKEQEKSPSVSRFEAESVASLPHGALQVSHCNRYCTIRPPKGNGIVLCGLDNGEPFAELSLTAKQNLSGLDEKKVDVLFNGTDLIAYSPSAINWCSILVPKNAALPFS